MHENISYSTKAALLTEIGEKQLDMEASLYRLEKCLNIKYDPEQPRAPAGQPNGGQWVSEYTTLTSEKTGNIIWNETRSLSGIGINKARAMIAHMVRNGEAVRGRRRPVTAKDYITGKIPSVEMQTYRDSQAAAMLADIERESGIDPTNGSVYMFIDKTKGKTKYGDLTVSTGPFHNSFPNEDVPDKIVYINFSENPKWK